ncbi:MAG: hypothetical protein Fur0022_30290 [Anaerolineales bacterium]
MYKRFTYALLPLLIGLLAVAGLVWALPGRARAETASPAAPETAYHTITIDGDLSDWASDELLQADGTYSLYLTWDATNLYLGLEGAYLGDTIGQDKSFFACFDTNLTSGSGAAADGYSNVTFNPVLFGPERCFYFAGGAGWHEWSIWNGTSWDWQGWRDNGSYYNWPGNPAARPGSELIIPRSDLGSASAVGLAAWLTAEANPAGPNIPVEASWPTPNGSGTNPTLAHFYHYAALADGVAPNASVLSDHLVINEFSPKNTEWVEIYNPTAITVTLTGWYLDDAACGAGTSFIGAVSLNPGAYFVVSAGNAGDNFDLDNSGDFVALCNAAHTEIDRVAYGNAGGAPLAHLATESVARTPNGTDTDNDAQDFNYDTSISQGTLNNTPAVMLGSFVLLNEFDNFPVTGNDKVEIYNPTAQTITLTGWLISDGDGLAPIVSDISVTPGGWAVLEETIDWTSTLVEFGSTDVGYLFMPDGTRVDQLGWTGEFEDETFQRIPDGASPYTGYNWTSSGGGVTLFDNPATLGFTNVPPPVLTITKNAPALVGVGDVIPYTIWVTNTMPGSTATGIIITDRVPLSTTYAYGGVYGNGIVTFTTPIPLSFGEALSVTFGVTVTANFGEIVTNASYAVSALEAPVPVLGAPVNTAISALDLIVGKNGPEFGFAGDTLLYAIEVENMGVVTANTVIVTDTLPVSTTFLAQNSNALTVTTVGDQVVWEFGDVPSGTLETIYLTVTVDAGVAQNTLLTNAVEATTTTPGDNQANNTDTLSTTIYQIVPIATARAGTDGEVFAVEGKVVYAPGTFNGSGWALQDASGGIGAFYNPPPTVTRGDTVRIMATRGSFNGEEQFTTPLYFFANLEPGAPVVPTPYTTAQVAAGSSEGWLVEIEGTLSNLTTCSGNYDFLVDDGSGPAIVFVDADTGVNLCSQGAQDGDTVRVVGFSTQFNADFEVKPRDVNDVQLILDVPTLTKDAPTQVGPGDLFTYTLTLQNFTGFTLTGVVITDVVPANSTFAYALNGGTETGGVVTWNLGNLPDQNSLSVQFAVTATQTAPAFVTNELYAVTASNYPTPTFGAPINTLVLGTIGPNCGDPAVLIHGIQGSGSASSIVGAEVAIEGVVVGDYQTGGYGGFFVQEEDADADADPMTSEGLFVFEDGIDVEAGDLVRVFGTVAEFNGLTELNQISTILTCDTGASVTPASVTLPIADLDEWEWYEGMLLNIPHPLYVTEVFGLGRYGEVSLSVDDRLDQPTQVTDPGANALALQDLNDRSRVQLNDGQTGQNPDPIIYPTPELSATNTLRGGDMLPNLTGVLNFSFGAYLIEPTGPITFTHSNPRPAEPAPLDGRLKVASFNVLNYFSTIDDGVNDICGPAGNQECRGADSEEEFDRQRTKIINALAAINADVVGLVEIENHPDDEALDDLISGLNEALGAGTYTKISTGPIGTDAIKVALIYKPATVSPVGPFAILDDSFDPNYHADYNRPALAQTFRENATGESFTAIVNHLKSKGSPCDAIGDPDTGDGQGNCNLTRLAAVQVLLDWIATDPTGRLDPDFLLLGDLNAYAMEDPIAALEDGGYTNLHTLTGSEYYSYAFDGQWGTLDYALANETLLSQVEGVTVWHINADEPIVLDYNTEFKSAHHLQSLYSPEPYRSSDHDPIIVSLDLTLLTASFVDNGPVVLGEVSVFTSTVNQTGVSYAWDFGDGGTSTAANPTHQYNAVGTYTVTLEVTNGFYTVVVARTHEVLPEPPAEETNIYLPIIFKPGPTSAVQPPAHVRLPVSGVLLACVGMGGVLVLRRKK